MKPGFWVSWRHLGSLKKARFDTAEERAAFPCGKPIRGARGFIRR